MNGDALKSTTVAISTYVRKLEPGEHELRLTGAGDPPTTIRDRPRGRALRPCAPAQQPDRPEGPADHLPAARRRRPGPARLLQHRSSSSASTRQAPVERQVSRYRGGARVAAQRLGSTLAEAEKPQGDELITPVVAPAGRACPDRRCHGPRRRDAQDPGPGRPAHRPSRRASPRGPSELMMRAPRPRVTKLNAQLMSTSRRF